MSHPHDDTDPIEHDPTGMRALLGSLPDPGPMPSGLVSRIEAALAAEARSAGLPDGALRAGAGAPGLHAVPDLAPDLVDGPTTDRTHRDGSAGALDADRALPLQPRRRSRWHLVAVAAAVVGVVGIGGLVVETLRPGGLTASLGVAEDSAAGGSSSGSGGAAPDLADPGTRTLLAEDGGLGVVVLGSDRRYTAAGLVAEVRAALPWDGTGRRPTTVPEGVASEAPERESAFGPLATPAGARDCADGLGIPADETLVLDLAVVDGRPAAVLVATRASGERRVWAVERTCTATSPGVLTGPATVS